MQYSLYLISTSSFPWLLVHLHFWLLKVLMDLLLCGTVAPRGLSGDLVLWWLGASLNEYKDMVKGLREKSCEGHGSLHWSSSVHLPCPTPLPGALPGLSFSRFSCEITWSLCPQKCFSSGHPWIFPDIRASSGTIHLNGYLTPSKKTSPGRIWQHLQETSKKWEWRMRKRCLKMERFCSPERPFKQELLYLDL